MSRFVPWLHQPGTHNDFSGSLDRGGELRVVTGRGETKIGLQNETEIRFTAFTVLLRT